MKSVKKNGIILAMSILIMLFCATGVFAATDPEEIGIQYRGHVQNKGDMPQPVGTMVTGPNALGTRGESLRVEGFWIELTGDLPEGAGLTYQVHVQNEGWMDPVKEGKFAGTAGKSQRVEAIKISLDNLPGYDVYYRGHVQNQGDIPQVKGEWGWVKNGEELGTTGSSLRLEELEVKIVKKADVVFTKAGTYGAKTNQETVYTNVVVKKSGVILQGMHITGDLTIDESVGSGEVTLNDVYVDGTTYINGGGANSIHIKDGQYEKIVIKQTPDGKVRIVATGIDNTEFVISEDAQGEEVIFEGVFKAIQVEASDVKITTQGEDAVIGTLTVAEGSKNTQMTFDQKTTVQNLVLNEKAAVKGQGAVERAEIFKDGVTFEKAPTDISMGPDTTTPPVINPPANPTPTPTPGGGGSGGGGGGTPTTTAITGVTITGDQYVGSTLTATPNPTGATGTYQWMRSAMATGTYETIAGATSKTYVLQSGDATKFIKVVITGNGSYTGTQTSVSTSAITNLKEITAYTPLTSITLSSDENLTDLAALKASSKLPTQVTVTDGTTPVTATITNWTGTFDGTTTGAKTLTAVWTMPTGYRDQTTPITVSITVNVNTAQTAVASSAKAITGTTIGTLDAGNITAVPVGTKVKALKDGLTLSPYATCEIMASSDSGALAVTDQENTDVTGTMVIKVTAQNNSTATYTIAMAPVVKSTTPTANTTTTAKSAQTQATVDFTLTSSHTGGSWKVFSNADCSTTATGISAALNGNTLTLTHATDLPAATYYVVWNDGIKTDRDALALTVSAYSANPTTVSAVTAPTLLASNGDLLVNFPEPNDLTGISMIRATVSVDGGQTWATAFTALVADDPNFSSDSLSLSLTRISYRLEGMTTINKIKVVSVAAAGYQDSEFEMPCNLTINKAAEALALSATYNNGTVHVTMPAEKQENESYFSQLSRANGTLITEGLMGANQWIDATTTEFTTSFMTLPADARIQIVKGSGATIADASTSTGSVNVTPLQAGGVAFTDITPVKSTTPTADTTSVAKTSQTQASVDFTLTSNHTAGTWKVYSDDTCATEATGVTASLSGSTLTLTHATDLPAATYYVVWNDGTNASSDALVLTVSGSVSSDAKVITATTVGTLTSGNITAVPAGTKVSALKAGLTVSENASVEILTGANGSAVTNQTTTDVTADMKIQVTAQNGTKIEYTIAMATVLSDAKVITATSVGTLDAGNITAVLAGTKVKALKDGLTLSANATCEIMATNAPDALAVTDQENTDLTGTMVIKVTAQNGSSTSYSITMASSLDAPTDLRAVAGNESIELHWSTVANAASYKVYQSTTSGTGYSEVVNLQSSSSYQVLNLTPGQTYYFVVKAVATGYNDSPNSSEVSAIANVTPSGSEISGNKLIISNESTDLATQSTGTLSSIITPPMNELNTEGMEGPIRINPEIPFRNSPDQGTLDASMLPTITSSELSDVQDFYTYNYTTTTYDTTTAHCAFIGTNVEVWVEDNATPVQLTDEEATTLGQEFDNNIYDLVTTNFFAASDVDGNGKITILCYDIKDGYSGGGYVGGYYDPNNQSTGTNSNQKDMIFVDTNPLIGTSKSLSSSYSTMAHELQHLVNFNCNQTQGGQMATWLNEAMSQAAEQMYNGVQANRITYFNNSTVIADGRSVLDWQQADSLPNYSLSYLFGQYLRTQAEQKLAAGVKTDIFKQIIVDTGNETTALTNAIHTNIDQNLSLGNVLTNFRVATALKATTGVYGFGKDAAAFSMISPKVSTLTAADLKGGGAIVKDISAGPFTVPTVHGNNITYTGVY